MHAIFQTNGKKGQKKGKKGQNVWKFGQKCTKFENIFNKRRLMLLQARNSLNMPRVFDHFQICKICHSSRAGNKLPALFMKNTSLQRQIFTCAQNIYWKVWELFLLCMCVCVCVCVCLCVCFCVCICSCMCNWGEEWVHSLKICL